MADVQWEGACQDYYNGGTHALAHSMVVTSFAGASSRPRPPTSSNAAGDGLAG